MTGDGELPTTAAWTELREDAMAIAERYRDDGWDTVVVDPVAISPSDADERFGFEVVVSAEAYDAIASLVTDTDTTVEDADIYYRPADGADQRYALAVEHDTASDTAIAVPLTYSISTAKSVLEQALLDEELLVHVRPADDESPNRWVTFSHDDPSLFLEEADVRDWELP
ncbi:hypothetical protein D8Y22_04050 [Salinadaptatus halalkaliphilus]|uniref:Uncharacterized protein n=1 Tax=Salinadaptatus halalkaliphilus TaxID=2419781 RepID=A0A4S3TRW5_9EURY|nr:hypothetical protein [Salinadaptatus halalkaliphilus]THE66103.1 hypothetical protein D8Y22_04050 [Salinadaptatus halalkaliphilus]